MPKAVLNIKDKRAVKADAKVEKPKPKNKKKDSDDDAYVAK